MFSCEICKISKNTYIVEHLRTASSDSSESDERKNDVRVITKVQKQSLADVLQNGDSKKFYRKTPVL